jgi:hypothetical protein
MGITALLYLTEIDVHSLDLWRKLNIVDVHHLQFLSSLDDCNIAILKIPNFVGEFDNRTGIRS